MSITKDNPGTVLVVDDTPASLSMVRMALEEAGYRVSVATTGEKAIHRAGLVAPDLILLDILMPEMDGYETCRRFKAIETTRDIPIIFLSGLTDTFDKVKGFQIGAVDYLIKPVVPEELLIRVQTHITINRLGKELKAVNRHLEERVAIRTRELSEINRMLRVLSECNQTLVRAKDETVLVHEICRILVEWGDYPIAWTGLLDPGEAHTVRPVAAHGRQGPTLDSVDSTWTETSVGAGPTGIAIRSGQPCITNDIEAASHFTPWRAESIRRGYVSSIALPLRGADRILGVLTIYATEANAFGAKEVELLIELAGDLAYGLVSLRTAAERKRAEIELKQAHEELEQRVIQRTVALAEREEQLRALINSMPDIVVFKDGEGRYQEMNDFGQRFFQLEGRNYQGKSDAEIGELVPFFRETHRVCAESDRMAWQKRAAIRGDEIMLQPEGPPRVFDTIKVPTFHADGRPKGMVVVGRDVTERNQAEESLRKAHEELERRIEERTADLRQANQQLQEEVAVRQHAEDALRSSEQRYRALYQDNPSMFFTLNAEGIILSVNEFGACQLGYAIAELEGQSVFKVFCESDYPAVLEQFNRCLRNPRQVFHWQFRKIRKNQTLLWVEEFARTVIGSEGVQQVLVVCQDITERKAAEDAKAKLEAQVRQVQKMEAIGTLAGGIAHDFNNILTAILSYTELARLEAPNNANLLESLAEVRRASERATALVRQILAFSRQTKLERKTIRLHLVIKEALNLLRSTLPTTIEIVTQIQSDSSTVLADPTQIHQVLMNLCTNAAHAMQNKPGRLTVSLSSAAMDPEQARSVPGLHPGLWVLLTVSDTGHGMDSETLKRIFEPFFTTKPPGEGTGLGLAVVHGIVKDHQGAIAVESQPGVGTTFHLYFPACQAPEMVEARVAEPPRGGGEHVLLVDDDGPIRAIGQKALERLNYCVTVCEHPLKAIEIFRAQPTIFDLVVTDLTMPAMTGVDLAMQIMQIRRDMPVILMTGYGGALTGEMAHSIGIREVLHKPITPSSLGETVHRVLRGTSRPPTAPL